MQLVRASAHASVHASVHTSVQGTHELDAQHGLAALVLEALRVLHELLPTEWRSPKGELHLRAEDTRRLISRLLQLDLHLQANLFLDT